MRENRQPSLGESAKNALEITADSPTLKALAQTIGISLAGPVGDILVQWVVGRGDQFAKERLEEFLVLLAQELDTLKEEAIRKDFFATPLGYDLLLKALDEARRTRSKQKRDFIVRILTGAVVNADRGDFTPEEYLHLVSDLTPKELQIALSFYRIQCEARETEEDQDEREDWTRQSAELCREFDVEYGELTFFLRRIEAVGVVRSTGHTTPGTIATSYSISPAFRKLMEFVRSTSS